MRVETIRDILHWTREFHQQLSVCLQHSVDKNESERAQLLLKYLGEHEKKLVNTLEGFEKVASESVLNTWSYEYFDQHPMKPAQQCEDSLSKLASKDIIVEVTNLHQQVIDLYSYLQNRAEQPSAKELLGQLAEMERHEIMQIVQSTNRLEDL